MLTSLGNRHSRRSMVFTILLGLVTLLNAGTKFHSTLAAQTLKSVPDGNIPVLTYKYDNQRTGENTQETALTVQNVNTHDFGQRFSYPVDGQIYAQPLYMPDVTIHGKSVNMVIVATEHDSVYAFDADRVHGDTTTPIWRRSLLKRGAVPVSGAGLACGNLAPEIGITSTPVIDRATGTIFVVSFSNLHGNLFYQLHALNLTNGLEKTGSPRTVQGLASFTGAIERQRSALLMANGQIYLAFASFCDHKRYHGWILGYRYTAQGFHLVSTYNDTPNGSEGGIWGAGNGISADTDGHIYMMSGNGTFDLNRGGQDAGDSFVKLDAHLHMMDYFAPFNQACLQRGDVDLGSGGPLIVPRSPGDDSSSELIGGGKEGRLYVIDIYHMGRYRTTASPCTHEAVTNVDHIKQEFLPAKHSIFSTPAYWSGSNGAYVFVSAVRDYTQSYRLRNGYLRAVSATKTRFAYSGGNPIVTSNGNTPGTGILWLLTPGLLSAYDATNLKNRLYSSSIDDYVKFSNPIVTDGKVFVPTRDSLKIYGLQLDNRNLDLPLSPTPGASYFEHSAMRKDDAIARAE